MRLAHRVAQVRQEVRWAAHLGEILKLRRPKHQAKDEGEQVDQVDDDQRHPEQRRDADDKADDHVGEVAEHWRMQQLHQPEDAGHAQGAEHHRPAEPPGQRVARGEHAIGASLVDAEARVQEGGGGDEEVQPVPNSRPAAEILPRPGGSQIVRQLKDEDTASEHVHEKPDQGLGVMVDRNAGGEDIDEDCHHDHEVQLLLEARGARRSAARQQLHMRHFRGLLNHLGDSPPAERADEVHDIGLELL
mmetsp:Transcript_105932/g.304579  ORF Transcript_105932/g.304579 Transcript_105932/m.304579 type:complete len:246 (-) Transcript_105932:754-1491(-)